MDELLKALKSLPEIAPKKHFVKIDGKDHEVSLQQKLEIQRNGEDEYTIEDGKITRKKPKAIKSNWKKLLPSETRGYHLLDDDIHWPEKVDEGGLTWQIEYE